MEINTINMNDEKLRLTIDCSNTDKNEPNIVEELQHELMNTKEMLYELQKQLNDSERLVYALRTQKSGLEIQLEVLENSRMTLQSPLNLLSANTSFQFSNLTSPCHSHTRSVDSMHKMQELEEKIVGLKLINDKQQENLSQLTNTHSELIAAFNHKNIECSRLEKENKELRNKCLELEDQLELSKKNNRKGSFSDDSSEVSETQVSILIEDLEAKMKLLIEKEEELVDLEESLDKEKKDIHTSFTYVQTISEELSLQKAQFLKDNEALIMDKLKIASLFKKIEETSLTLQLKEHEILHFKDQLDKRELLIQEKEKSLSRKY